MKKLLLMISCVYLCRMLFAQTSTVSGMWKGVKQKQSKMFKIVEGGNLSEVATSALGEDGSFRMTFTPEQEGYFRVGYFLFGISESLYILYEAGRPIECADITRKL